MEDFLQYTQPDAVPREVRRWSWGAFLLTWIWGIGNNVFIAFLMFVPLVNLIMWIVLGVKGGEWAWRNKQWDSIEHFQSVQRSWARWGAVVWGVLILMIALAVGASLLLVTSLKDSEPMQLSRAMVKADRRVVDLVGEPMSTGFPEGSFNVDHGNGHASANYSVSGPTGKGLVTFGATRSAGQWRIDRLDFTSEGSSTPIVLTP